MSETTTVTPQRRVTLAQVAEHAGVSLKTASRALGGEPHVTDQTRQRVLSAATTLGYRRNTAASLLASGRVAELVGLVTGDLTNPFYAALAQGLEDVIDPAGVQLNVASTREDPEQEWRLVRDLADLRVRGLVIVSAMDDHSRYAELQARGIELIFVDRPAQGVSACSVISDNLGGGRAAATHLLQHGHRRISFVGDYSWLHTYRQRVDGMGQVLDPEAPQWRELIRDGAHDSATARRHVLELESSDQPPTAYVAGNNRVLLGILEALSTTREDRPMPAVLGFDDVEWGPVMQLSVVATDPYRMGRLAGEQLIAGHSAGGEPLVVPTSLIARGSGERQS